jgi:hypothetical protein
MEVALNLFLVASKLVAQLDEQKTPEWLLDLNRTMEPQLAQFG